MLLIAAILSILLYLQASALAIPVANHNPSAVAVRQVGGVGGVNGGLAGGFLSLGPKLLGGSPAPLALGRRGASGSGFYYWDTECDCERYHDGQSGLCGHGEEGCNDGEGYNQAPTNPIYCPSQHSTGGDLDGEGMGAAGRGRADGGLAGGLLGPGHELLGGGSNAVLGEGGTSGTGFYCEEGEDCGEGGSHLDAICCPPCTCPPPTPHNMCCALFSSPHLPHLSLPSPPYI